jgi:hypothetical protein
MMTECEPVVATVEALKLRHELSIPKCYEIGRWISGFALRSDQRKGYLVGISYSGMACLICDLTRNSKACPILT